MHMQIICIRYAVKYYVFVSEHWRLHLCCSVNVCRRIRLRFAALWYMVWIVGVANCLRHPLFPDYPSNLTKRSRISWCSAHRFYIALQIPNELRFLSAKKKCRTLVINN